MTSPSKPRSLTILLACMTAAACTPAEPTPVAEVIAPCTPSQPAPYPSGIPYVGIHGNAANSDLIPCRSADAFTESWHALAGHSITQPNTFSPDGQTIYITTANPEVDGCRLHALDAITGEVNWCQSYPPSVSLGAVEVDEDGTLYFGVETSLHALTSAGEPIWQRTFEGVPGVEEAPWGLHFTPDGHIATVTSSGTVYLVDRGDGQILAQLSIPETWGFVAPATIELGFDLSVLLPESTRDDISQVWGTTDGGEAAQGFGALLGASGFCDNTVGISADGDIFVIGGGPDEETGALVQLHIGGTAEAPTLERGWYTPVNGGSGTSPSIDADSRYVVIGDGSSSATFLNPEDVDAWVRVMDIPACDANTDSDPNPEICGVAYERQVERAPLVGAPAILENGEIIYWEFGMDFSADASAPDLVSFGPEGLNWEVSLPDDLDWASVITVTENHLIGTAVGAELSGEGLLTVAFPHRTDDRVVVIDRFTGEMVWQEAITDDGTATVTIGPDGALYVGMLGIFSVLSLEETPTMGLIRFEPTVSTQ